MIPTIQSSTHGRWTQQHDLDLAGSLPVQGSVGTSELPSILPIDQHDRVRSELPVEQDLLLEGRAEACGELLK